MYTKEQLQSVNSMNKATLREACKAAAIKGYGKMTVAQMRAAVQRHIEREMKKAAPAKKRKRATVAAVKPLVLSAATTNERTERNGVREPGVGVCRDVWDALSKLLAGGTEPTAQHVRDLSTAKGWNPNNSSIELGRWRKYHGIAAPKAQVGKRGPRRKSAAKLATPATLVDTSQPAA